jgi:hypothetical protein
MSDRFTARTQANRGSPADFQRDVTQKLNTFAANDQCYNPRKSIFRRGL